jgi:hypothetical protein
MEIQGLGKSCAKLKSFSIEAADEGCLSFSQGLVGHCFDYRPCGAVHHGIASFGYAGHRLPPTGFACVG